MSQFKNTMEIFQHLNKSNCRKCNEATCLAFAASVFQGKRQLKECPDMDQGVIQQYFEQEFTGTTPGQDLELAVAGLQKQIKQVDLLDAAKRLGGVCENGKLIFKIFGKDFGIDSQGKFYTDIHVHTWIAVPVLNYILQGEGLPLSGRWVPLRELPKGKDWYRLFGQRCEKPIKKVADTYTDFFDDMIHLFSGNQVERVHDSDISVVLYALPNVPILICYWKPEDGLESDLHLFFDDTAESNLNIESIYSLGAGIALMFEKLSQRHG
ncbi:MAG: DUF3786 domain-containing protein [Deltaproteobacteria bacterium]|nr:DUF3786 domain-containing protein [Deltaproteobacteria bacterium]NNK85009.1 DUF3786 domain-containing protein [Desulfobacterales bacterium]